MSRPDIEDVLSSIRRLVSEEGRPDPARARPQPERAEGRLVLTPALRVAEPPVAEEPAEEVRDEAPEAFEEDSAAATVDPEAFADMLPETTPVDAAATAEPEDWLPEAEAEPAPQAEEFAEAAPAPHVEESAEEAPEPEFGAAPMFVMRRRVEPLVTSEPAAIEDTIAELESKVAERGEQWDPDGTDDTVDENHSSAFDGPVRFFHRPAAETRTEPEAEEAPMVEMAQESEELQVEEPQVEEVQPEESWFEPAQAESAPDEGASEQAAGDFDDSEALLDEETLREIVREAIREELQGQLGERITRNVRKLVRAEINRAFASRDFE